MWQLFNLSYFWPDDDVIRLNLVLFDKISFEFDFHFFKFLRISVDWSIVVIVDIGPQIGGFVLLNFDGRKLYCCVNQWRQRFRKFFVSHSDQSQSFGERRRFGRSRNLRIIIILVLHPVIFVRFVNRIKLVLTFVNDDCRNRWWRHWFETFWKRRIVGRKSFDQMSLFGFEFLNF